MRLMGIFIFELIYSNKIHVFINSNKNQHYFLQFNEVKNSIFILFLVWYISNDMGTIFCCVVLLNPW